MRVFFYIIAFLFATAASAQLNKQQKSFLKEFAKCVKKKDNAKLKGCFEPEYYKQQHDEFLQGRTSQFLTEFFCGFEPGKSIFTCPGFEKVVKVKFLRAEKFADEAFQVFFRIYIKDGKQLTRRWFLINEKKDQTKVLGIVGASG